jgi:Na+-driven multidrug efflux pump
LKWRLLRVEWESLGKILWIGIPAGVQWMCFSFSNLLVQATVNSFGPDAIAGNTASVIWETFCFIGATAVAQTVTSFVSRNLGGKQYGRVRSSIRYCSETAAFMMGLSSFVLLFFPETLLSIINADPNVIAMGKVRFMFLAPVLLFCGTEEVFIGALRGLGHSVGPSLVMLFGICVFRIVWLLAAFPRLRTFEGLIVCYPLSWLLTFTLALIYIACLYRKLPKRDELQP